MWRPRLATLGRSNFASQFEPFGLLVSAFVCCPLFIDPFMDPLLMDPLFIMPLLTGGLFIVPLFIVPFALCLNVWPPQFTRGAVPLSADVLVFTPLFAVGAVGVLGVLETA